MRIKFKRAGFLAGSALAIVGMMVGQAGASSLPPKDATGTVHCSVKGGLKFDPPLILGGKVSTTVTLKTSLTGCTGTGDGAKIKSGKTLSSYTLAKNDCAVYFNPATPFTTRSGSIQWSIIAGDKQKLNPSTIQFTSGSGNAGPPITSDQAGTSLSGSFHGDAASAHAVLKNTSDSITKKCVPPKGKGVKSLTLTTGSTFTLS